VNWPESGWAGDGGETAKVAKPAPLLEVTGTDGLVL
jgi:hypothetical protein